ncbi:MAG: hypothetical protein ACJ73E_01805 [Mycobacteriales bacterium]
MTALPGLLTLLTLLASLALAGAGCTSSPAEEMLRRPWRVTVYYTAVQELHTDQPVMVRGCPTADCDDGDEPLGEYPKGFAEAVREEGTGRITTGPPATRYLNWSYDTGYWLDDAPRDAHGRPLEPFRSAAADGLPDGTELRLVDCGQLDSGEPVPADVCDSLRSGRWQIRDRFTPELGGEQHIDLYIGEESGPDFTSSGRLYVSLQDAHFGTAD